MTGAHESHAELDARLRNAEFRLGILGRKSRGTTLANKRAASLHADLIELRERLGEDGPSPVLVGRIASLEGAVNDMQAEIEMLVQGQQSLSQRLDDGFRAINGAIDAQGQSVAEAVRVSRQAASVAAAASARTATPKFHFGTLGFVIAVFIGLAWYALWFLPHDFTVTGKSPKGTPLPVFVGNMLDTPFGWVLVALLIFAIAVFIGCITGSTSYDDTSSAVATAQVNQTSVDPSTPRSAPHISEHTQENPVVRPRAGIELARLS